MSANQFEQQLVDPALIDERYRMVFENSHEGVYVARRDGRILRANPAMEALFGYTRPELLELNTRALFSDPEDLVRLRGRLDEQGFAKDLEVRLLRKDGRERSCLLTAGQESSSGGGSDTYQAIILDLTERVHAEERLRHATLHDSLTQLPNRVFFLDRLRRLLQRTKHESKYHFAVLFVDLDDFKLVNDSLGHRAGDELLVMIAERLAQLVRPEDIVARFGGDEFTILLMDLAGVEEASLVADRIHEGLEEKVFDVLGHEVYVTASIGITVSDHGYADAEDLIRDADTAMYAAKDGGRGEWVMFDDAMRARAIDRFATETAIKRGLEEDEFLLHYQPLVDLDNREIIGFEALLRWDHPERGVLPPAEFLSVAEETGLIVPLGRWVLYEACRTAAEWRAGISDGRSPIMSVNLSARQLLVPDFGEDVRSALEQAALPGEALHLEITETVLLATSDAVRETLAQLDDLGVWLCLDDFGTGYSSLGYLQELPVNLVKIDRSFISRVSNLPGDQGTEMVQAILSLARGLDVETVAEGVETEMQRESLLRLGCAQAQGFLFSKPVDAAAARGLLGARDESEPSDESG